MLNLIGEIDSGTDCMIGPWFWSSGRGPVIWKYSGHPLTVICMGMSVGSRSPTCRRKINVINQSTTTWGEYICENYIILCIWDDLCIPPTCQCRLSRPQSGSQMVPASLCLAGHRKLRLSHERAGCSQTLLIDKEVHNHSWQCWSILLHSKSNENNNTKKLKAYPHVLSLLLS